MDIWPLFLLVGALIGTLAGLFGIGGGLITVPLVFYFLKKQGVPHSTAVFMAIKTSLAIIIFTSSLSAYTHNKIQKISWKIVFELTPGIILGTIIGTLLSSSLKAEILEIIFTIYVTFVSSKMWFGLRMEISEERSPPPLLNSIVGMIIGMKSALLGIGGGTISIPYLNWQGVPMRKAVGVSACVGFIIAVSGTITSFIQPLKGYTPPPHSLGPLYIPALGGIVSTGLIFTKIGSHFSYKLPQRKMQKGFALLLFAIALKSIGNILGI